jgi:hypothetical protein
MRDIKILKSFFSTPMNSLKVPQLIKCRHYSNHYLI